MKKTLKQFIFETLDNGEYITDTALAKFCNGEPKWNTAEEYKRQYWKLRNDRNFFEDKNIIRLKEIKRMHIVFTDNGSYKCGKEFYNEVKDKYKLNFSVKYFYQGNELYNIKDIRGEGFSGHDILANWKDKNESNKEKLGKFRLSELEIKPL